MRKIAISAMFDKLKPLTQQDLSNMDNVPIRLVFADYVTERTKGFVILLVKQMVRNYPLRTALEYQNNKKIIVTFFTETGSYEATHHYSDAVKELLKIKDKETINELIENICFYISEDMKEYHMLKKIKVV